MKTHLEIPNLHLNEAPGHDKRYDAAILAAAEALGIVDVEEYETEDGWRWRRVIKKNSRTIDAATQGFHDREECRENFRQIYRIIRGQKAIRWVEVEG